jgi:hypothetical protein
MRTQTFLTSIITACAVIALGAVGARAADKKADPNGTWSWTQQARGGGGGDAAATPRKSTLKLKADGEKLTGTLTQPAFGRRGQGDGGAAPAPVETAISNGKVKGDEISFEVTREAGGNSRTTKYAGKIDGDTIKGKFEAPGRQGGDPVSRDWEAKREAEKK